MNHGESPAEFFDYKCHPFADTYRLKTPYLGAQDQRFFKTALSLISTGKSLALCGPSGAGKSTLVHYVLSKLDANCYKPAVVHYGGLQRNGILKALADVFVNGREEVSHLWSSKMSHTDPFYESPLLFSVIGSRYSKPASIKIYSNIIPTSPLLLSSSSIHFCIRALT